MLGRRMRSTGMRRVGERAQEAFPVARERGIAHPFDKLDRVGRIMAVALTELIEVVREAARTDDEHAVARQRGERRAEAPSGRRVE